MIVLHRQEKFHVLALMRDLMRRYCYQVIGPANSKLVEEHFNMMANHPDPLQCQIKFETVPELQLTRLILEASFVKTERPKQ